MSELVTITHLERRREVPAVPLVAGIPALPTKSGWDAIVVLPGDIRLGLSQLDGEDKGRWIIDSLSTGACPTFMNGWGARFGALVVAPPEVASALSTAAAEIEGVIRDAEWDARMAEAGS